MGVLGYSLKYLWFLCDFTNIPGILNRTDLESVFKEVLPKSTTDIKDLYCWITKTAQMVKNTLNQNRDESQNTVLEHLSNLALRNMKKIYENLMQSEHRAFSINIILGCGFALLLLFFLVFCYTAKKKFKKLNQKTQKLIDNKKQILNSVEFVMERKSEINALLIIKQ